MGELLRPFFEGFAFPDNGFDEPLCEHLAVAHARQTLERVLHRHPDAFADVADRIRVAAASPLRFDDVWCLPISSAWANLRSLPGYPPELVEQLLSRWVERLVQNSDAAIPENRGVEFIRGNHRFLILYREHLLPNVEESFREQTITMGEHESVAASLRAALDFIDRFAPEFGPWVLRLLRGLIPLGSEGPDAIRSGSSVTEPGLCHMSLRCGPAALAEMLVHEVTHQYYYLLTRAGPVDDGTDDTLYYSPVKRCGRPVHYILIAYHAFANVLLFSRRCLLAGYDDPDGYVRRNVRILTEWSEEFDKHLRSTPALTVIGKSLWRPLAAALAGSGAAASLAPT